VASSALEGPAEYFAEHPFAWAVSMSGAGTAAGILAARSVKSVGSRRVMWATLFLLEIVILAGIFMLPRNTHRSRSHT
jgi:hypothetical protein